MARLPLLWNAPNGAADQNNWGSILNAFLQVAHNADGTINLLSAGVLSGLTTNGVLFGTSASTLGTTAQGPANSVLIANAGVPSFSANPTITTLSLSGTYVPGAAQSYHLLDTVTTTVSPNQNAFGIYGAPTLNKASSGTHTLFASLGLNPPAIGAGAASLTRAATLYIDNAPTVATTNYAIWATGPFRFDSSSATTSFALGGDTSPNNFLYVRGSFTGNATGTAGIYLDAAITGVTNGDLYGLVSIPGFNRASSGTHVNVFGSYLGAPISLGGAAAVTNAASLYISGAPAFATNNYALWVAGGNSRFDGLLGFGAANANGFINFSTNFYVVGATAGDYRFRLGNDTGVFAWENTGGTNERMRLTSAGILLVGTTVTGTAIGGEIVIPNGFGVHGVTGAGNSTVSMIRLSSGNNTLIAPLAGSVGIGTPASFVGAGGGDLVMLGGGNTNIRFSNNAGTSTLAFIGSNSSDQLVLGSGTTDIKWSKALVALGGGAAPTFGTIGGSGPAAAAQNTWMRIIDSTGAAFFVPAWK